MKKWMSIICLGFVVTGVILGRNGLQSQAAELKQPEKIEIMANEKPAAKDGFQVINGKTYYYRDGERVKGWLTLNGKRYYLNSRTGVLYKGWFRLSNGAGRYFDSRTGAMKLGFARVGGKWYYFEPRTGWSRRGTWTAKSGNVRYFRNTTRDMVTGWVRNTKGERRYFQPFSGIMCKGLKKIRGKMVLFRSRQGCGLFWLDYR